MSIVNQLDLLGLEGTRRLASEGAATSIERERELRRVNTAHELLSTLPEAEDLSFLHSGLCQTALPHSRPTSNHTVWRRTSGRFTLSITPGTLTRPNADPADDGWVGVPYGTKARLILIHLQTEGMKSRTVSLGSSLSAFLRSLGQPVTGGPRGSIAAVREQALRIARCSFSLQWRDTNAASGATRTVVSDTRIVDGLEMWESRGGGEWNGTVELSSRFHEHLCEHAVPLDKRAIAHLSGNSLGLDLYALFAYRLPRLTQDVHLRWAALQSQIGSEETAMKELARRVRNVLPDVLVAYPHAKIEATSTGLTLRRSQAAVPKLSIRGFKLIDG
jgi:hypothetical protein